MSDLVFPLNQYSKIRKALKKRMDKERYWHTLGVAYTAANMAMCYGVDINRAFLAGLLHDSAKPIPDDEKLAICAREGIAVTEAEERAPGLLHAVLGAYVARTEFKVTDPEILTAIEYHTVGRPNMTTLEKIIYVADLIEPNRPEFPMIPEIRQVAYKDLDLAMYYTAKRCMDFLIRKGTSCVDPRSLDTIRYYREKCGIEE